MHVNLTSHQTRLLNHCPDSCLCLTCNEDPTAMGAPLEHLWPASSHTPASQYVTRNRGVQFDLVSRVGTVHHQPRMADDDICTVWCLRTPTTQQYTGYPTSDGSQIRAQAHAHFMLYAERTPPQEATLSAFLLWKQCPQTLRHTSPSCRVHSHLILQNKNNV